MRPDSSLTIGSPAKYACSASAALDIFSCEFTETNSTFVDELVLSLTSALAIRYFGADPLASPVRLSGLTAHEEITNKEPIVKKLLQIPCSIKPPTTAATTMATSNDSNNHKRKNQPTPGNVRSAVNSFRAIAVPGRRLHKKQIFQRVN
jgi:hypothetical protein